MTKLAWQNIETAIITLVREYGYEIIHEARSGDTYLSLTLEEELNLTEFAKDLAKRLK